MMLKQTIRSHLEDSQRARDELKTSTLRMLISAIKYFEIAKKGTAYEATDEEVLDVIRKEAKKRTEAIEMYAKNNRPELAEKETKELEVLSLYLPKQMGKDEIKVIVRETIQEIGAKSPADMGKVMSAVMLKLKGKADGSVVNQVVRDILSK